MEFPVRVMLKVIGLGNALRGDDCIGPHIIEVLKKIDIPVPIQLFDFGSDAFSLVEHLAGNEPLLIIDCAKLGKAPGTVLRFELNEQALKTIDQAISLHGFSFGEVYRMAQAIGQVAPCRVIGIEPKALVFGTGLSEEVNQSVDTIINLVIEEAKKHAE